MATRMLIDARHPEETRVAVVKGNRIEEFDFESAEHKQIKGNIYLAKVTRVEPSLQAAFVDFGGNRHGFLAFSEIHPDYYQIPAQDREALLAEEQAAADEEAALREQDDEDGTPEPADEHDDDDDEPGVEEIDTSEKDKVATIEEGQLEDTPDDDDDAEEDSDDDSDDDDSESDENEVTYRNSNLTKEDRKKTLQQDGIPPAPTALITESEGNIGTTILISTERLDIDFSDLTQRTYWQDNGRGSASPEEITADNDGR